MKVIVNKIIPFGTFVAVTIGPFIFTKDASKITRIVVNHEAIHWEQQKELLILFCYILYGLFFLLELVICLFDKSRGAHADGRHRSIWKRAYRSIPFEREAYSYERDQQYLRTRRHYAWIRE